eukprot:TRINITY_DN431_c0_g1_i1.p2 TRINITY_DN431_c0_g1~~TRINITY_DN431_c0_g1_i1.p2  ORF type:complete len:221 (+),score=134.16 TRINITY_DN431_c0_g1_i1:72-665(+)
MSAVAPALKKLRKSRRGDANDLERNIAQLLFDLEVNNKNLKSHLTGLHINSVRPLEVTATKTAYVVFFPLRYIRRFHKIQKQLVSELEKKLQGKQVLLIAQRKIARQMGSKKVQRSRTMKAVHESILEDILYPADVCGKRIRQKVDGSKHLKVFLDSRDKDKIDHRLDTFRIAYNKLTGREVSFGYMTNMQMQQVAL